MSKSNPYAAKPKVKKAPEPAPAPVEENVEAVPEGSIATVLAWVGDSDVRAKAAYDAELEGKERTSLLSQLEDIIEDGK